MQPGDWLPQVFTALQWAFIGYVAAISGIYLLLMVLGFYLLRRSTPQLTPDEVETLATSPLMPEVSVIAPAYNEALTIRESVRGMLRLAYPAYEVIVVNDGSSDNILEILIEEFRLFRSARTAAYNLPCAPVRGVYESRDPIRLLVIDKENGGSKADANNAALNYARTPLVTAVDSDSLIESSALVQVVYPFVEDPGRTVASGGIVRIANGCKVEGGQVTHAGAPRSWLARFQVVEYLRAFLAGRVAFDFLRSLLIVSGAFGVFRREEILRLGGYSTSNVGEDMELVIRLHHDFRKRGQPYRVCFVPEPVCWTEAPESWKSLSSQRNRWQRGTVQSLREYRGMIFNPRYGVLGLFALPYFLLFEALGPTVELAGYFFTAFSLGFGLIPPGLAVLYFAVSVLFGVMLSVTALLLEEFTLRRYSRLRDLLVLLAAAVLENVGYRQAMTVWRTQGLWDGLRGRKKTWGEMKRRGFGPAGERPA